MFEDESKPWEDSTLWTSSIQYIWTDMEDEIYAFVSDNYIAAIYRFHVYNQECAFFLKQTDIIVPGSLRGMHESGFAKSLNGRYIFICGGYSDEVTDSFPWTSKGMVSGFSSLYQYDLSQQASDSDQEEETWFKLRSTQIFILDTLKSTIYSTSITIPTSMAGSLQAICMAHEYEDKLTVDYFLRQIWQRFDLMAMPIPLMWIIYKYYYNEYLHIIQLNKETRTAGLHFKINTRYIIDGMFTMG